MFAGRNKILKAIGKNKLNKVEELIIKYRDNYDHKKNYAKMCEQIINQSIGCDGNDMINLLLKYIDVTFPDEFDNTILMNIIEYGYSPENGFDNFNEKILIMLNHVGDINLCDTYDTVLDRYIAFVIEYDLLNDSSRNVITKMLDLGSNIFKQNREGYTVVSTILSDNSFDILKHILEHENYNNTKLDTGIIIDALAHDCTYDIFEFLLSYIDNINTKSDEYDTSIKRYIRKIKYNNSDVIELLVAHGLQM